MKSDVTNGPHAIAQSQYFRKQPVFKVKMSGADSQSGAPDAWDADVNDEQVDTNISKPLTSLNINAPSFVPGQNPFASSFVPSGAVNTSGKYHLWYLNGLFSIL